MKIVLVRPPYTFEKVESFFPPLGLLSIGSVLYRKGHQVNIIDLQKSTYEKNLPLDDLFYHEAAKMILDYKPDIVGFTSMSVSYALTIELSKEVKSKNPNIITIFGGPQATLTASR